MMAESSLSVAAVEYAQRGFAVFPLVPRSKDPRIAGGFKAATRDPEAVARWWRRWPNSNIGIATGVPSGVIAFDVDPRNGGDDALIRLTNRPEAPTVHTGGGGIHEYYAHPGDGDAPCRRNAGGLQGIDVKGDGGYVVAPPSIHPSGSLYQWDVVLGLDEVAIPPAPAWLLELSRAGNRIAPLPYEAEAWNGTIPAAVEYAIAVSGKVFRRFNRDTTDLSDTSPSGVDYSLACLLSLFTQNGGEIEAGIRASRAKAELAARPKTYYEATVGKALRLAREVCR